MTEAIVAQKRLEGKVVIITGGASGIGEATARLFAHHGPRMIVLADIQDLKGQDVATSIGPKICSYVHCDVTDELQVKSMVDWTVKSFGQLDVLFSNAGTINPNQTLLELDLSAYDHLMGTNARGMATCVKHAAQAMVNGGVNGSIVCMASVAASKGTEKYLDYTMSKHAVLGLMRSASVQLGKYGIRVNCVSPSALGTPLTCATFETDTEGVEKIFSSSSSLKGLALKMNHVADAVLFLASNDSAFVSGHNLALKMNHVADAVLFLASNDSAFVSGHNLAVDGAHRPS